MRPNKPIPGKDMEARNKLQAEAGLEERKTILGWLLDTRRFLVQLPKIKFVTWMSLINTIIQRGITMAKEVEIIIGQLGHPGMTIPFVHHFLSRLCNLHTRAKNRRLIPINDECCKDLELVTHIIKIVHDSISMNIIVYRWPTHIYHSDSCPAGLGRYSDSGLLGNTTSNHNTSSKLQTIFWSTLRQSSRPGLTMFAAVCI